jgi:hypothetical protein
MSRRWIEHGRSEGGAHVARVMSEAFGEDFETDEHPTESAAVAEAVAWQRWADAVAKGATSCVYYIVAVPENWPGAPPGTHPYTGLRVKIGRTRDLLSRLRNLQTGSFGRLVVRALEPGGQRLEATRQKQFGFDRRLGEWFACSDALRVHMSRTFAKYRVLPPGHGHYIEQLDNRSPITDALWRFCGGPPDMVNPSLGDPWHGTVFLDLVHFGPLGRPRTP